MHVYADIDECAQNGGLGPCDHMCTNTPGSFYCSCEAGYTISDYNCKGKKYMHASSLHFMITYFLVIAFHDTISVVIKFALSVMHATICT